MSIKPPSVLKIVTLLFVTTLINSIQPLIAGDSISPKVSGMLQLWGIGELGSDNPTGLLLKRSEIAFTGQIIPGKVNFVLMLDPASVPVHMTQDLLFSYKPSESLSLSIGQLHYPLTMEGLTPSSKLLFIDRATITGAKYGDRRDIGIVVDGSKSFINYSFGVFNGSGTNTADNNRAKDFSGRIVLQLNDGLDFGASTYYGAENQQAADTAAVERMRAGVDCKYSSSSLQLNAEYMLGTDDDLESAGYYASLGYSLSTSAQIAIRYDGWDPNSASSDDEESAITLGYNHKIGGSPLKLMVNYVAASSKATDKNTNTLLFQIQTEF